MVSNKTPSLLNYIRFVNLVTGYARFRLCSINKNDSVRLTISFDVWCRHKGNDANLIMTDDVSI